MIDVRLQNINRRLGGLAAQVFRTEAIPGFVRRDRHQGKREKARRLKALEKAQAQAQEQAP